MLHNLELEVETKDYYNTKVKYVVKKKKRWSFVSNQEVKILIHQITKGR